MKSPSANLLGPCASTQGYLELPLITGNPDSTGSHEYLKLPDATWGCLMLPLTAGNPDSHGSQCCLGLPDATWGCPPLPVTTEDPDCPDPQWCLGLPHATCGCLTLPPTSSNPYSLRPISYKHKRNHCKHCLVKRLCKSYPCFPK